MIRRSAYLFFGLMAIVACDENVRYVESAPVIDVTVTNTSTMAVGGN